jgi:hypothetical protein
VFLFLFLFFNNKIWIPQKLAFFNYGGKTTLMKKNSNFLFLTCKIDKFHHPTKINTSTYITKTNLNILVKPLHDESIV